MATHDALHSGTGHCNCTCADCWYQWTVTTGKGEPKKVGVFLCPEPPPWFRAGL